MIRTNKSVLAGAVALLIGTAGLMAQNQDTQTPPANGRQRPGATQQGGGRRQRQGNDPAQFQQRMTDRYRDRLEITDDAEWKAIQPLIQKVIEARLALDSGRRGASDRGSRGGDRTQADPNQRSNSAVTNNPEAETLQKAITGKASNADLKIAAARYLEARKAKQAKLEKTQEDLRNVLTQRQESIAMLAGLL
jgi:hypothetical protein